MRQVVATTRAAGSARVLLLTESTAVSPAGRFHDRSTGVVSFRTDAYRLTVTSGSLPGQPRNLLRLVQVGVGHHGYLVQPEPMVAGRTRPSVIDLGGPHQPDAIERVFGELASPAATWQVHDLGRSSVGGDRTTRYLVTTRPPYVVGVGCSRVSDATSTVQIWVDRRHRLVRAETITHFRIQFSQSPGMPARPGPSRWETSVNTVDLSDFGVAVTISPPPVSSVRVPAYRSSVTVRPRCT